MEKQCKCTEMSASMWEEAGDQRRMQRQRQSLGARVGYCMDERILVVCPGPAKKLTTAPHSRPVKGSRWLQPSRWLRSAKVTAALKGGEPMPMGTQQSPAAREGPQGKQSWPRAALAGHVASLFNVHLVADLDCCAVCCSPCEGGQQHSTA